MRVPRSLSAMLWTVWVAGLLAMGGANAGRAEGMPAPQPAQVQDSAIALAELMKMDGVLDVMRAEGLANGAELAADLPGGASDAGWLAELAAIYNTGTMREVFDKTLAAKLAADPEALAAATTFFSSTLGQKALQSEIDARRALLDKDVERTTELAFEDLVSDDPARVALLTRFSEVNDLVETNVMGALNANLSFFRGISDQSGEMAGMDEADMLSSVWEGEAQTRIDTQAWLFPFLMLAYQPLSDEELKAYIDFSDTPEGQRVNAAVFAAFDELFNDISYRLGQSYGRRLTGQDI